MARHYKVGRAYSVRLDGHNEPAQMRSIEVDGMNAGGGIMLLANRGDGEIDRIVSILNASYTGDCTPLQEDCEVASLRKDYERECADTDRLLGLLGFNPKEVRTEGGSLNFSRLSDLIQWCKPVPKPQPLTEGEMEKGRDQIFSINNPFCPCDSKTFKKVAQWVERHHRIGAA